MPKLRRQTFETAIIERYRRRDLSIEEAIVQMYLAGVSVRRVPSGTVSNLNRKVVAHIERWRSRAIEGECAYMCTWTVWRSNAARAGRSATSQDWRRPADPGDGRGSQGRQGWLAGRSQALE